MIVFWGLHSGRVLGLGAAGRTVIIFFVQQDDIIKILVDHIAYGAANAGFDRIPSDRWIKY